MDYIRNMCEVYFLKLIAETLNFIDHNQPAVTRPKAGPGKVFSISNSHNIQLLYAQLRMRD